MLAGERPGGDWLTSLMQGKHVGHASTSPVPFHGMQALLCFVQNGSKSVGPHNYRQFVKRSQSQHQWPVTTTKRPSPSDRAADRIGHCPSGCRPVPGRDGGHASLRESHHPVWLQWWASYHVVNPSSKILSLFCRTEKDSMGFLLAKYDKLKK